MSITIRRMARDDGHALLEMYRVCQSVGFTNPIEKLRSNWLDSSPDSVCYGGYVNDRLVGINLFIAHTVLLANVRSKAYQAGWSAIDPAFRDRNIALGIIIQARSDLKKEGACLIFGFPNAVTEPLYASFSKFKTVAMHRSIFLATGPRALRNLQFDALKYFDEVSLPHVMKFDQHENFKWKSREYSDIVSVEYYTNFIWGRIVQQKMSPLLSVPALIVGGCEINMPQLFGDLLGVLRKKYDVVLVRCTTTVDSLMASATRFGLDGSKTEPLVYLPLIKLPDDLRLDAHVGLKDAF